MQNCRRQISNPKIETEIVLPAAQPPLEQWGLGQQNKRCYLLQEWTCSCAIQVRVSRRWNIKYSGCLELTYILRKRKKAQTVDFCRAAQWQQKAKPQLVIMVMFPLNSDDDVPPVLLMEGKKQTILCEGKLQSMSGTRCEILHPTIIIVRCLQKVKLHKAPVSQLQNIPSALEEKKWLLRKSRMTQLWFLSCFNSILVISSSTKTLPEISFP